MLESVRHEPSYQTDLLVDEELGIYAGCTALEDSFSGALPCHNERRDISLILAGEDFPEPGLRARLRKQGHEFENSGPSYIVHVYEEDSEFPSSLNGTFHGLLVDRVAGTSTLFNDRYGLRRIYYHESDEGFYFAAEVKAILAARPELRRSDGQGLGELVACGCVLENRTVFRGIGVLPTAAAWVFRDGSPAQKRTYFRPEEWEEQSALEPESYYRELRSVFSRNLPRYFGGRGEITMSLTGGLDTRAIMAWQKAPPNALPCHTFGGTYRDCRDVSVGRKVAEVCRQPHEVISVGTRFLSRFPDYAQRTVYLTDGCAGVNRAPDLFVNEQCADIAPIRMTGNYGDEILMRERAFRVHGSLAGLYSPEFSIQIQQARKTFSGLLSGHPLSFVAFKQCPWHHYGLLALEQTQVSVRTPFLDNELVRNSYRAPESALASNDFRVRLIGDGNPALRWIRTDLGFAGKGHLSAFASRSFQHFTFKAEYAYDYGMPQWLSRVDNTLSALHLERLFLGRHKFCHFRVWYRDALSAYVREILLDHQTLSRPYLHRKRLEEIVEGHLKGDHNYTTEIHQVLTLELLHRLFFDAQ